LATRINRTRDIKEREALWQQLLDQTASMMTARDGDRRLLVKRLREGVVTSEERKLAADLLEGKIERPDHRPSTLDRELRENRAKSYLRTWWWLEPQQRVSRRTAFKWVKCNCRLERAEAFEILKQIKAEVVKYAELADGTVVEPATAMRAPKGFLIRKQDESRQRPRRRRKIKMKG
jgi:hypothetical protein